MTISGRFLTSIAIIQTMFVLSLLLPALDFRQSTVFTSGSLRPVPGWFAFIGSISIWVPIFAPPKDFVVTWTYLIVLTYLPCNIALTVWPLGVFSRFRVLRYVIGPILFIGCLTSPCVFLLHSVQKSVFENAVENPHIGYYLWVTSIVFATMANGILIFSQQNCQNARCTNNGMQTKPSISRFGLR